MKVSKFPQAIVHIDVDAFFASVEYSTRLMDVIKRFTPQVEKYSIDEAFADISGLRRLFGCCYEDIAKQIKDTIEHELGITVSVGLSTTKGLAKLASKFEKPSGFTVVTGKDIERFLELVPIEDVWGFGKNSVALLKKHGVNRALDFTRQSPGFAKKLFGKVGLELWNELSGQLVHAVDSRPKTSYASISKFKTFNPPTKSAESLFSKILLNLEKAVAKMRLYKLATKKLILTLRTQSSYCG